VFGIEGLDGLNRRLGVHRNDDQGQFEDFRFGEQEAAGLQGFDGVVDRLEPDRNASDQLQADGVPRLHDALAQRGGTDLVGVGNCAVNGMPSCVALPKWTVPTGCLLS
jgi:hypothetical protein